jgi:hypothetical protein
MPQKSLPADDVPARSSPQADEFRTLDYDPPDADALGAFEEGALTEDEALIANDDQSLSQAPG